VAKSTGIVVAAGALSLTDLVLTDYDPSKALRLGVGTVLAALVSAGLDKVVPGFGTGAAVVLLAAVVLTSGPRIVDQLWKPTTGMGRKP